MSTTSLFLTVAAVPNSFPGQYRLQTHCCRSPLAAIWRFNHGGYLLAHRLGIIDADYVSKTGCAPTLLGRKVMITDGDVRTLVAHLKTLAGALYYGVARL